MSKTQKKKKKKLNKFVLVYSGKLIIQKKIVIIKI
jgi:hypothetical protein